MTSANRGFTLIELSVVLVIIGLLAGGILVGQDLIKAAEIRGTAAQVEKYRTAVNTFRTKYNALPGDMTATQATPTGFAPRGQYAGEGDGNGIIEGIDSDAAGRNRGWLEGAGETIVFWRDLGQANLVDGGFTQASSTTLPAPVNAWAVILGPGLANYFPPAKLGKGEYLFTYSYNNANYFGLEPIIGINVGSQVSLNNPVGGLTVNQAYQLDQKTDDGLPQSGSVTARFVFIGGVGWASAGGIGALPGTAATADSTTCYDNGGNASQAMTYSLAQNGGNNPNCMLSFRFQ